MPDRLFKPETGKDDLSSASTEEFFETLERADVYLPVSTEVSPVSPESRIVMYTDPRSAGADRFRLVQIRLTSLRASRKLKSLLITSPLPEDGKSTITLNLATGLSEEGKRPVLVVEADVHRPTLLEKLGLKAWPGMSECYRRGSDPMLAIRRIEPLGFYLLPAGQPAEDGSRLLQSDFASQLIKGLSSSSFGWILIDSPPATPVADVIALKAQADATLLVVRAGETPREDVEEATRNLGRDHIIGIILNGVEGLDRMYSKYYGYGRSEAPVKKTKPKLIEGLDLNKRGR
jgi:capsular exopolysaccharide synthesis family protein